MKQTGLILLIILSIFECDAQLITKDYQFNADPTCREINGKFYVFTTHDQSTVGFQGPEDFWHNMYDYHAYSTTDFKTWTDHGSALSIHDVSWATDHSVWDGDIGIPANGKYYAYVPFRSKRFEIGVLVADRPEGPYIDALGKPLLTNDIVKSYGLSMEVDVKKGGAQCLSSTIIYDDKNNPYLLFGQFRVYAVKLKPNMIEFDGKIFEIDIPRVAGDATEFIEGPWIHKMNDKYYFSYMTYKDWQGMDNPNFSDQDPKGPYIQYCVSDNIFGPYRNPKHWIYPLNDTMPNNQHAVGQYRDKWYLCYHVPYQGKQHRQVFVTNLETDKKGNLLPVYPSTDRGVVPQDSVKLILDAFAYKREAEEFHERKDADEERGIKQDFHFKMKNDGYLLFKNMDFGDGIKGFKVSVSCENSKIKDAKIEFRIGSPTGRLIGEADIGFTYWITYYKELTGEVAEISGIYDLYIVAKGRHGDASGRLFNINWFTFY